MGKYDYTEMEMKKFSYQVKYPRTGQWWSGDWQKVSDWCNNTIGTCTADWEYINECFAFNNEQDQMMFILKWK